MQALRGHHGSAVSHIRSGIKILSEINFSGQGRPEHRKLRVSEYPLMHLRDLEVMFNRLDAQVIQLIGTLPMQLDQVPGEPVEGFHTEIPMAFATLEEARNSFDYHWNGCNRVFNIIGDPPDLPKLGAARPALQRYEKVFATWEIAFNGFLLASGDTLDMKARAGVKVLQLVRMFSYVYLDAYNWEASRETVWDRYSLHWQHGVELAEAIIEETKDGFPQFCLEMYFVGPMFAIAHKCRDPVIRRKAVAILEASSRQEGMWDSRSTALAARRLIAIEEGGLGRVKSCADVPDWARLSAVEVKLDPSGRIGAVNFWRASPTKGNNRRPDYTEVLPGDFKLSSEVWTLSDL